MTVDAGGGSFAPLAYQGDAAYPLANSFKVFVLYEVLRRVDAGDTSTDVPFKAVGLDAPSQTHHTFTTAS